MTHQEIITAAFQLWLAAGCKTYGLKHHEILAKIPVYVQLLGNIDPTTLQSACEACAQTCRDFPTAADVRKAATDAADAARTLAIANPETKDYGDCQFCGGGGWEVGDDGARKCRCRTPGFIAPPAKPRRMLTDGERAEIERDLTRRSM